MALSNKFGALVLTTGNKSEMSTGYCTLYGDMVGALAVIGDVLKTRVYALSRYANREREVIRGRRSRSRPRRSCGRTSGHGLAAAVRGARPDSGGVCGAVLLGGADCERSAGDAGCGLVRRC
jgi:hypothetical protein